jgi:hypothetical protein
MGQYSKYKLGTDVSVYQQYVDYKTLKAQGLDFVIARTGKGINFDTRFAYHCQGAADAGLPFFGYHVPDPSVGQDPVMDRDKSFLNLVYTLQNKTYAGLVADCEIYSYIGPKGETVIIPNTNLSSYYLNFSNQVVKFLAGAKPFLIYSSVGFIQSWMPAFNNQIIKFDPFMAQYPWPLGDSGNVVALKDLDDLQVWIDKLETLYGGGHGPLVPSTCKANKMIQFSGDHFTLPTVLGATHQVSSCDFDLFIGTDDEWDAYIHKVPGTVDEPIPEPLPQPIPVTDLTALQGQVNGLVSDVSSIKATLVAVKTAWTTI